MGKGRGRREGEQYVVGGGGGREAQRVPLKNLYLEI